MERDKVAAPTPGRQAGLGIGPGPGAPETAGSTPSSCSAWSTVLSSRGKDRLCRLAVLCPLGQAPGTQRATSRSARRVPELVREHAGQTATPKPNTPAMSYFLFNGMGMRCSSSLELRGAPPGSSEWVRAPATAPLACRHPLTRHPRLTRQRERLTTGRGAGAAARSPGAGPCHPGPPVGRNRSSVIGPHCIHAGRAGTAESAPPCGPERARKC